MNENTAARLVGLLIGATTGWSDESGGQHAVVLYSSNIAREWHDMTAAEAAIRLVSETWTKTSRPPWAVLHTTYRDCRRRHILDAPSLPSGSAVVSVPVGREIAARAYAEECARQGRPADMRLFDRLSGSIT